MIDLMFKAIGWTIVRVAGVLPLGGGVVGWQSGQEGKLTAQLLSVAEV
jgi:hypothetical protein